MRRLFYKTKSFIFFLMLFISTDLIFNGCSFFEEVTSPQETDYESLITSVKFSINSVNVNKGEKAQISVKLSPSEYQNKVHVDWDFDKDALELSGDSYQAVITGKKAGVTYVKAECNGIIETCLVSVISNGDDTEENPYIYSNDAVVEMLPDKTYTLTASLYGGNIEDMEDFTWSVANPGIAEIIPGRNNCIVKSRSPGSTTVTASHPKAKYEYTFIIFCYTDKMTVPYITTTNNVISIDKNTERSRMAKVDLKNSYSAGYISDFVWSVLDDGSQDIVEISASQNCCDIRPLKPGIARIRVTHPQCPDYPLDIVVRVTAIVANTYISLDQSTLLVNGSDEWHSVTAKIENYNGLANPEAFTFEVQDETNALALMDWNVHGNVISIKGKKNGKVSIKVGHELAELKRTLLVILQEQIGSAIDSSMYITTTQNYVQTKVGAEPTVINVSLVGGEEGVDNVGTVGNFEWYVEGYNGSSNANNFVSFKETTGRIFARSVVAAASGKSCSGIITIDPRTGSEGNFSIFVKHPRCLYETEIKVKILSEYALTEPPITIESDISLLKLVNNDPTDGSKLITPKLIKNNLELTNDAFRNLIEYESENVSVIKTEPSTGPSTTISAIGSGKHTTYVNVHLNGALADKKILVLSADSKAEVESMKAIYSDVSYARLMATLTSEVEVHTVAFEASDIISWSVDKSNIVTVNPVSDSTYHSKAVLTGISKGTATVTATAPGCDKPVVINVTVTPVGEDPEIVFKNAYLTTNTNAVVIEKENDSAFLEVTGVNIEDQTSYSWTKNELTATDSEPAFTLSDTGLDHATVTANKAGKAEITVSHSESKNELKINVKCGSILEWTDGYIPYIVCENGEDVINIVKGQEKTFGVSLANTDKKGTFFWSVTTGNDKIDYVPLGTGTCSITGKEAGQAIITVTNSETPDISKEILVNVANSPEELALFKYLTTQNNVVTVGQGQTKNVSVSVINATNPVVSGYTWTTFDDSKVTVVGTGANAVITGCEIGTSRISVSNEQCTMPLEIIVNVVDPIAVAQDPYISCPNIITITAGGSTEDITAELIGGTDSMSTGFTWYVEDSSIATVYGSNSSAKIKGIKEGVTRVVVQHPAASVPRRILVICEPPFKTDCNITVSESIVKISPSDKDRTITATLVGGSDSDIYGFKWWADSYDIINMNYAQNQCTITPISCGTVTIHVSHPKAKNQHDIIIYISQYTDFAFAQNSIQLETGGDDTFVQMEVPASGTKYEIAFKSTDDSICTAWGNSTVCSLHPGSKEGSCTIIAELKTKGGNIQAKAELLVAVAKKDIAKPYIGLSGYTVETLNVGEERKLGAVLHNGNTNNSAGLTWRIPEEYHNIIEFKTSVHTGSEVLIRAVNSGKAILEVSHSDVNGQKVSPVLVYIIVKGTAEPTVQLNWTGNTLYVGEDATPLIATVMNDDGSPLKWVIEQTPVDEGKNVCDIVENSPKLMIQPRNPGTCKIICTIGEGISANQKAICEFSIEEPPRLDYFVYKNEDSMTGEVVVDNMNVYPGKSKYLHYISIPKKKDIKGGTNSADSSYASGHYLSDEHRISVQDLGYGYKRGDGKQYPENIGTLKVTGASQETTTPVSYRLTTVENVQKTVFLTNSYNYDFSVDKTSITMTPREAIDGATRPYVGPIKYKISPSCGEVRVTLSKGKDGNLAMKYVPEIYYKNSKGQIVKAVQDGTINGSPYVITDHLTTDPIAESAEGEIWIKTDHEFYGYLDIYAVNKNIVTGSGSVDTERPIGQIQKVILSWYYLKHEFRVKKISSNPDNYVTRNSGKYSEYNPSTNVITLGDGEDISVTLECTDYMPTMHFSARSIEYKDNGKESLPTGTSMTSGRTEGTQASHVGMVSGSSLSSSEIIQNKITFRIKHNLDYGGGNTNWYRNTDDNRSETVLAAFEKGNETVKENTHVANLLIQYQLLDGSTAYYRLPVYVKVRNVPAN